MSKFVQKSEKWAAPLETPQGHGKPVVDDDELHVPQRAMWARPTNQGSEA